jgi:hypothetical protein
MVPGGRRVSQEAEAKHAEDVALGNKFTELLEAARTAEAALRLAQARGAPVDELRDLGKAFDRALTEAMQSAYAAQRAAIGARGYDDWIYRRKAMATRKVKVWTAEAEALLTLREAHLLGGIARVPGARGLTAGSRRVAGLRRPRRCTLDGIRTAPDRAASHVA